ncbi:hypothetical protein FACS1894109_17770 [Spirochaetia bacterium]|nr:hypothetical protein FACS1894109_17770 [Spirochaetia bacterium]
MKITSAPLDTGEAAEYMHFKKSYFYQLTRSGKIPCFRPTGGKLYFRREDLDAFIFRNRQGELPPVGGGQ